MIKLFWTLFSFFILSFHIIYAVPVTTRIYGVTVDDVSNLPAVVDALKSLGRRTTVRVVFDEQMPPANYQEAIDQILPYADIMGEILDSYYVKTYSVSQYIQRVNDYLNFFGDKIAIWEIGNEVNGEWLLNAYTAQETALLIQKLQGAYTAVKSRGYKTALTFYYNGNYNNGVSSNDNCWSYPGEDMMTWANANVPSEMKAGLDYVFISYYEDDCNGYQPNWQNVFDTLGNTFPASLMGIGECGSKTTTEKATGKESEYLDRYYKNLNINHPRYVWGDFWWYFIRDMVPKSKALWTYFFNLIGSATTPVPTPVATPTVAVTPPTPIPTLAPPVSSKVVVNVSSITMNLGRVSSDQPLSVLNVLDQTNYQDDWNKYKQFFESGKNGLVSTINFKLPSDLDISKITGIKLVTNVMMAKKSYQVWNFDVRNFSNSSWIRLGDNSNITDWKWGVLTFNFPNNYSLNIDSNRNVKIQFSTPAISSPENAQVDYMVLEVSLN